MRRLTKNNKSISFAGLFLELVIVFSGVYLAFLLSNYQKDKQIAQEGERVIALVQVGIGQYQELFEGFALYHERVNTQFRTELENNTIPDFSRTFYPAPAYPIDVINFILTKESYEIFTLDVYVPLIEFANAVQQLMYVEEKLVMLSEKYEPIPSSNSQDYDRITNQQRHYAVLYLEYMEIRKNIATRLSTRAKKLAELFENL